MKTIILLALIAFTIADEEYYVLEKIDTTAGIDELKNFLKCLMEEGPCTELYESYRILTPECIHQACKKCTLEQKKFVSQFLQTVKTLLPQEYEKFKQKYDPGKKYLDILEKKLSKYRID